MNAVHRTFALVAAAALAAVASPAQACSVCGCGDRLVGAGPVVTAGLRYEFE